MGGEFAQNFPKIAGRLGLQSGEAADPLVERMLEGFAFLAARVQMKLQARFPDFTQHMLQMVYPHFLAPVPSMAIVQFKPDEEAGRLEKGYVVPRGTMLTGGLANGTMTHCQFRTAHDVHLWPIGITACDYYTAPAQVAALRLPQAANSKAVLRLRLKTTNGLAFNKLALRSVDLHLTGASGVGGLLMEHLLGQVSGMMVRPSTRPFTWEEFIEKPVIRQRGLHPDDAMLPVVPRSFDGYRLLQEYFALPERVHFLEIGGLADAIMQSATEEIEILIMMRNADQRLARSVGPSNIALFSTPVVNLFKRSADRIHVSDRQYEYHAVIDKLRPMDFELHTILDIKGDTIDDSGSRETRYQPFYSINDKKIGKHASAYYTMRREKRLPSTRQQVHGARTGYIGSEVFLSLSDGSLSASSGRERQLQLTCLCSNRDLPLLMPVGVGDSDFSLEIGAPVAAITCIQTPTPPQPSVAEGDVAWHLLSHLSLNYLSINDSGETEGAGAEGLRELLRLYAVKQDPAIARQIDGVRNISSRPVIRRLKGYGQASVARGLEITILLDDTAFEGVGCFALSAVLNAFFAKYVSINSFTETVLVTQQRGLVMRWDAAEGLRPIA
ncbi:type VI secretion system baseplate subunit TssF [Pararhizobium arenae]|uniref:type VI secretion system baseplate subunit TssF n=1 Tax=Pararhizobium arenae TaxID=1856850 RepID=UPI001FD9DF1F|nr:type VI secretion system baseplate subunit TssF [Pararhizobium arenae]